MITLCCIGAVRVEIEGADGGVAVSILSVDYLQNLIGLVKLTRDIDNSRDALPRTACRISQRRLIRHTNGSRCPSYVFYVICLIPYLRIPLEELGMPSRFRGLRDAV